MLMPSRPNPKKLNALQLKTLTVLQQLARTPMFSAANEDSGEVLIRHFPNPHGDHFHCGDAVVMAKDATGLRNRAVWTALQRKGLAQSDFPNAITLTAEGVAYETGIADRVLLRSDH